jgi:hypothetical protein
VFSIDASGNVFFAGKLSCPNDSLYIYDSETQTHFYICVANSADRALVGPRRTAEFEGEAVLAGGSARVALPHQFGAGAGDYHIFLTPLGDGSRPLRVARRDARGFLVDGGSPVRAMPFAYRVVAERTGFAIASAPVSPAAPAADAAAAPAAAPTPCTSSSACIAADNGGSGAALEGISKFGIGVTGTATGTTGTGVAGLSVTGAGLNASSTSAAGLRVTSTSGTALAATTASKSAAAVLAQSNAANGIALSASAVNGAAILATGKRAFFGTGAISVRGTGGAPLLIVRRSSPALELFSLDDGGGVGFSGKWNCPAVYNATAQTCDEQDSLATRTIERTGEARLHDGFATVALDPEIVRQLGAQTYQVTVTPEDDSAGWLYVATRTAAGFVVREHGGRSSIRFAYDIVATAPGRSP